MYTHAHTYTYTYTYTYTHTYTYTPLPCCNSLPNSSKFLKNCDTERQTRANHRTANEYESCRAHGGDGKKRGGGREGAGNRVSNV